MKKLFIIIFISTLAGQKIQAQDMQFTQFYASALNINPAFTGANVCSRVSLLYRNQWPAINQVYKTKMLSFDHCFYRSNFGIGGTVAVDEAGDGNLKTTLINTAISYEAKIKKGTALRLGLQPGIGMKSVNYSGLLFGDQIYRGGSAATLEKTPQSRTYFDLGAGMILVHRDYWAGVSAYHLTAPIESFYTSPYDIMPLKYSIQAGARFQLNGEMKTDKNKKFISPVIHYRAQRKFDQVDLGVYYTSNFFTVGAWYRGLPLLKAYQPGYSNNDAFAIIAGLETKRLKIGYSYDFTISQLSTVTKGAHEVSLSFQICKQKKLKRRLVLISCPKF